MNLEILKKIEMTKESLKTTLDNFIIDHLSGCYNELFLHEYLLNCLELDKLNSKINNLFLIYFKIDKITEINIKYSSDIGNKTIANLAYLIKQVQSPDDLLFRTQGPIFVLLVHNYKGNDIKDYISEIQNAVKKSEVFIESISVSSAVVSVFEVDKNLPNIEKSNELLTFGTQRINLTHELGNNAYIDQNTIIEKKMFGNILIIDSDVLTLAIMKSFFQENNYKVITAIDGLSALEILKKVKFDAIIADRYSHKIDGLTIKKFLNNSSINMNSLFLLTVQNKDINIINQANSISIDFVFDKPVIFEEILGVIKREITRIKCAKL